MTNVRPLSPITYFRRNLGRTLPLGFVIVLSVFLIASVVTIVNSIDLTVLTIYNYAKVFTPIIPRSGRLTVDDDIRAQIHRNPRAGRVIDANVFIFNVNTVFGGSPFACFGVTPEDRDYLIQCSGDTLAEGRMPASGVPEAVISEGLVHNKKLKLGDMLTKPADDDTLMASPVPVRLVGILKGPTWLALTSREFVAGSLPLAPTTLLVTARNRSDQLTFAGTLLHTVDHVRAQVFSYNDLVHKLRRSLASMYLIMHLVNATVIFVVALMSGMLSNIYFTQRISEFAVLAAIGIRRSKLVWHAISETAILTSIGWFLGGLVNFGLMSVMQGRVFEPRGMLINPHDPGAYLNTLPIPVFITLFAVATISYRLATLDPVTIIERR